MIYFTDSHEWIEVDGEVGKVGITAYAKKELGEIVYLEFPLEGKKVKAGDEIFILESTKAAADIYTPVSGEILTVNTSLRESLSPLNHFPETTGWLFTIHLSHPEELYGLMTSDQYRQSFSADFSS